MPKGNYVSHVVYETAGVLTFAEDVFGLARLAKATRVQRRLPATASIFPQPPRPFVPDQGTQRPGVLPPSTATIFAPPDYE